MENKVTDKVHSLAERKAYNGHHFLQGMTRNWAALSTDFRTELVPRAQKSGCYKRFQQYLIIVSLLHPYSVKNKDIITSTVLIFIFCQMITPTYLTNI